MAERVTVTRWVIQRKSDGKFGKHYSLMNGIVCGDLGEASLMAAPFPSGELGEYDCRAVPVRVTIEVIEQEQVQGEPNAI